MRIAAGDRNSSANIHFAIRKCASRGHLQIRVCLGSEFIGLKQLLQKRRIPYRSFHNSDGQKREETGLLINGGQELVVYGSYSYTGPDNKVYRVDYVADRNGFKPKIIVGSENIQEDSQTIRPPQPPEDAPAISPAAYDPNSEINPHALKSLLGG